MSNALQASFKNTPFSPKETILNWVENFAKFSSDREKPFDTYGLICSDAWEQVSRSMRLKPKEIFARQLQLNRIPR